MSYEPYLIANFATGLETDKAPWIIPDDAQEEIFDGYIEHGVIRKRDGYRFFANGQEDDKPYCESRIVSRVTAEATGRTNNGSTLADFTLSNRPLRRGSVTITDGTETYTDDGEGGFPAPAAGAVNYVTGVVSGFTFDASSASAVTATYDYYPGLPVMMIAQFVTATNVFELIVADEDNLNKYNSTTNRFDDITNLTYTGSKNNFFDWTQYPTVGNAPRLVFTNNVNPIQWYNGTSVSSWFPAYSSTTVASEVLDTGDGTTGPYGGTTANPYVIRGTVEIVADPGGSPQTVTDDGDGSLTGDGTGTINYQTGVITVTFNSNVASMANIEIDYEYATGYVQTCLKVFDFKDRLILLRTTETGGTVYPQRIRISGTGQSGDDFRTTASGAGVIDIPDPNWIMGASFNRDDLIIYTQKTTWMLKYTGNDIVPFTLVKIDGTRGNKAPFAPISYLNFNKAYSPEGFTITDGYQVNRFDERITDFCFEEIDQDNFDLCFSGSVDDDRNHYLIHPSPEQETSDRILVNNYEENNFAIFRIPLSCMGQYYKSFDTTWSDLSRFDSWDAFAAEYGTWNDISYAESQPIALGGGHKGEIWELNADSSEDNPLKIWGIAVDSSSPLVLTFTTDWHNYAVGDYIFVDGTAGSTEINGKQGFITEITDDHNFNVQFPTQDPETITAWTSGGFVSRTIPFEFKSKNFNPFSNIGSKMRCGWIYFYADISGTFIEDIDGNSVPAKLIVDVYTDDRYAPTQVGAVIAKPPYQSNLSNIQGATSKKHWYKMFVNQIADFMQFKVHNTQAGSKIRIHAIMPGFMPVGRLR